MIKFGTGFISASKEQYDKYDKNSDYLNRKHKC